MSFGIVILLTLTLLPPFSAATTTPIVSLRAPYHGGVVYFAHRQPVASCATSSIVHAGVFSRTTGKVRWEAKATDSCGPGRSDLFVWGGVYDLNFTVPANGTYGGGTDWRVLGGLEYNLSRNASSSPNSTAAVSILSISCFEDLTLGTSCKGASSPSGGTVVTANGTGVRNFSWHMYQHPGGIFVAGHLYCFKILIRAVLSAFASGGGYASATLDLWSGAYGARLIFAKLY